MTSLNIALDNVGRVSDQVQFRLSTEKPGAYLGLANLEQAYASLLTNERLGINTHAEANEAVEFTRIALTKAYERLPGIDAEKEVAALTAAVQKNLDRIELPQGRAK